MSGVIAIFDVDGTLTETTGVDDAAFVHACEHVLGAPVVDRDWANYRHSTDQGLCTEICERAHGRRPTDAEIAAIKEVFFRGLRERIAADPACCVAAGGAQATMRELIGGAGAALGIRVAIASGAWPESARIKLDAAALGLQDVPACFSHALSSGEPAMREQIILNAAAACGWSEDATAATTRLVYIGDGVWDARASAALGIGFIGMRLDGDEKRLRAAAPHAPMFGSYFEQAAFVRALLAEARPVAPRASTIDA